MAYLGGKKAREESPSRGPLRGAGAAAPHDSPKRESRTLCERSAITLTIGHEALIEKFKRSSAVNSKKYETKEPPSYWSLGPYSIILLSISPLRSLARNGV
ncbi:hypothetical protein PM082_009236 [Marasmius tenuissimus]|nr:hypothetical protein PM082_009236 [Marasmius tenuissimus]